MKKMKEEYPKWLEQNHEKISYEELERYNKQLDLIESICGVYDKEGDNQDKVFVLLNQLQELGSPPQELMKTLGEATMGKNPFGQM